MMHTDISRAFFFSALSKKEKHVQLPLDMWSGGTLEYGRLRVSLYGLRDAAANWDDAYAKGGAGETSLCAELRARR